MLHLLETMYSEIILDTMPPCLCVGFICLTQFVHLFVCMSGSSSKSNLVTKEKSTMSDKVYKYNMGYKLQSQYWCNLMASAANSTSFLPTTQPWRPLILKAPFDAVSQLINTKERIKVTSSEMGEWPRSVQYKNICIWDFLDRNSANLKLK